MSDNIVLDDGRVWWSSTIVVANVLHEIGKEVLDYNPQLSRWLLDLSDRPAPFMHFDIRGLTNLDATDFYRGALSVYKRLSIQHGDSWLSSNIGASFNRLIEMHHKIKAGEPPENFTDSEVITKHNGELININELWNT